MATTTKNNSQYCTTSPSIDANTGPWSSIDAYLTWLNDELGVNTPLEGTEIQVKDSITGKISKYRYEISNGYGSWIDVSSVTVDSAFSPTSTYPVQNKAIFSSVLSNFQQIMATAGRATLTFVQNDYSDYIRVDVDDKTGWITLTCLQDCYTRFNGDSAGYIGLYLGKNPTTIGSILNISAVAYNLHNLILRLYASANCPNKESDNVVDDWVIIPISDDGVTEYSVRYAITLAYNATWLLFPLNKFKEIGCWLKLKVVYEDRASSLIKIEDSINVHHYRQFINNFPDNFSVTYDAASRKYRIECIADVEEGEEYTGYEAAVAILLDDVAPKYSENGNGFPIKYKFQWNAGSTARVYISDVSDNYENYIEDWQWSSSSSIKLVDPNETTLMETANGRKPKYILIPLWEISNAGDWLDLYVYSDGDNIIDDVINRHRELIDDILSRIEALENSI